MCGLAKLCHIMEVLRQDYVNISHDMVWGARETSFGLARETPKKSYSLLHAYGKAPNLENPKIVFEIELEGSQYFQYLFMALAPCL